MESHGRKTLEPQVNNILVTGGHFYKFQVDDPGELGMPELDLWDCLLWKKGVRVNRGGS